VSKCGRCHMSQAELTKDAQKCNENAQKVPKNREKIRRGIYVHANNREHIKSKQTRYGKHPEG
jgi:hypothetical protein